MKILIVDDEPDLVNLLIRILSRAGYEVIAAVGSEEARLAASVQTFDLLLADVEMAGTRGPALADELKAQQPSLRVLFLSGVESKESLPGPLIQKPCRPGQLIEAVGKALS